MWTFGDVMFIVYWKPPLEPVPFSRFAVSVMDDSRINCIIRIEPDFVMIFILNLWADDSDWHLFRLSSSLLSSHTTVCTTLAVLAGQMDRIVHPMLSSIRRRYPQLRTSLYISDAGRLLMDCAINHLVGRRIDRTM